MRDPGDGPGRSGRCEWRLFVDLDRAVREWDGVSVAQFDNACVVPADSQFGGAGQHTVAFDAGNHLDADGNVDSSDAWPAVRRAAYQGLTTIPPRIDYRFDVVTALERLYRFHNGRDCIRQQGAYGLDAFALGGLHGDETLQRLGGHIEVRRPGANEAGEFHSELTQEPQIAAQQPADIVDGIAHRDEPRQSETEREPVPLFGIDTA